MRRKYHVLILEITYIHEYFIDITSITFVWIYANVNNAYMYC